MGMDSYIDIIKKDPNNKQNILERKEAVYWRKFYALNAMLGYGDSMYGKDLRITKSDLEDILQFVTHNRDYFDGFSTVPDVCELLDTYDDLSTEGWSVVFNSNW